MSSTVYEWTVETLGPMDDAGEFEVVDVDHFSSFEDARAFADASPAGRRVVLVRDVWIEGGDLASRSWARVVLVNVGLPDDFADAYGRPVARVPKRFHAEVARARRVTY